MKVTNKRHSCSILCMTTCHIWTGVSILTVVLEAKNIETDLDNDILIQPNYFSYQNKFETKIKSLKSSIYWEVVIHCHTDLCIKTNQLNSRYDQTSLNPQVSPPCFNHWWPQQLTSSMYHHCLMSVLLKQRCE